jgi:hypothetical protein
MAECHESFDVKCDMFHGGDYRVVRGKLYEEMGQQALTSCFISCELGHVHNAQRIKHGILLSGPP